jgi:crotonobetainyl-CoA:carnitine CoA-transferase CaiB-like acyl-CoA transferase
MDHVEETGTFVDVEHPRLGEVTLTDTPFDLSETDAEIREPAPVLGQHNREVLREAGYSADEIDDLHRDGVLEEGDV